MNDADSAASTRSPVTASEKPAPAATPLTAMISTASIRANDEIARCRSSATPLMNWPRLGATANDFRSPPAQKNRPDPVITTTFVASVSQRLAASASSRVMVSFMPFAASGRLSVIRVMGPDCSNLTVWYSVTPGLYRQTPAAPRSACEVWRSRRRIRACAEPRRRSPMAARRDSPVSSERRLITDSTSRNGRSSASPGPSHSSMTSAARLR